MLDCMSDIQKKARLIFAKTKDGEKNKTEQVKKDLLDPSILTLPVIPVREGTLFPGTESVLTFGRKQSLRAIKASSKFKNLIVLVSQKKSSLENPKPSDLYDIGTLAIVERTLETEGQVNALVRGISRVRNIQYLKNKDFFLAVVQKLTEQYNNRDEIKALTSHLQKEFRKAVQMGKPVEFLNFMKLMSGVNEGELVDQIASTLQISNKQRQSLLEEINVNKRLKRVIGFLAKEMKVLEIEKDVASKTQQKFDKHMRENVLRERMRTIQKELGELDDGEDVVNGYEKKLKKQKFASKEILSKVKREVKRLKQMSVNNPEAGYIRTWLDTMFELPWGKLDKESVDLKKAAKVLDEDHYGLQEVKDRVLEYISVLELKQRQKTKKENKRVPTILCFVGPPGVGKTSIGKSIARALGRKFVKISLGGIRDEAEIRGHRRTYVGAMTGRIMSGIKQAESMNPVFMLDEVDKIGSDFRGDPSAALLEALDPEQNAEFEDHYLDVPFDLSHVLFITTANTLETIPAALKDRLEIIRYSGYTLEEKQQIAHQHLLKKVLQNNGLSEKQIKLGKAQIQIVIEKYTREAGVRELERQLSKIMRKIARKLVENKKLKTITVAKTKLDKYLGPEKYEPAFASEKDQVGLATGLAWTRVGGDVLFIEVALTPGKGRVKLTGKLGDVMKESAQAAFTYVKANAKKLEIKQKDLESHDVHIHVPQGAVPKDGPSAGVTIATAVVSAFSKKAVKRHIAMTGEITLRGMVLKIGGLKEKSIAAHRAGCTKVFIPHSNKADLAEVPDSVKKKINFAPVKHIDEILDFALSTA